MLKGTKLHVSSKPRLAVCIGLVLHTVRNPNIFPSRCVRASFGIGCRVRYGRSLQSRWKIIQRKAKQEKRPIVADSFNQRWVENCVDWFIKKVVSHPHYALVPPSKVFHGRFANYMKGDHIRGSKTVTCKYSSTFDPDIPASKRICKVKIMTSFQGEPSPFEDAGKIGLARRVHMDRNYANLL